MDVLAPTSMKNAAKCDTSCELQNPVNHQNFERILRFRDIPGSMPVGVSAHTPLTPRVGPRAQLARPASSAVESERRSWVSVCPTNSTRERPSKSRPAHLHKRNESRCGTSSFGPLAHSGCGKSPHTEHHRQRDERTTALVHHRRSGQDLEGLVGSFEHSLLKSPAELHRCASGFSLHFHYMRPPAPIPWTSNQARGPAEFKHITRPRKRN